MKHIFIVSGKPATGKSILGRMLDYYPNALILDDVFVENKKIKYNCVSGLNYDDKKWDIFDIIFATDIDNIFIISNCWNDVGDVIKDGLIQMVNNKEITVTFITMSILGDRISLKDYQDGTL